MPEQRLYSCPNCDEWIVEGEWDAHAHGCREYPPAHEMTESEIMAWVSLRNSRNPNWAAEELELEKHADKLVQQWEQTRRGSGAGALRYPVYTMSPTAAVVAPSGHLPNSLQMDYTQHAIIIPDWMTTDEARVLVRHQLRSMQEEDGVRAV